MPRGLGDDPLAKKRRRSGSTPSQGVKCGSATVKSARPSQTGATFTPALYHNDIFFKRRGEGPLPAPEIVENRRDGTESSGMAGAAAVPEITEAFEIVRVAEVVQSTQTVKVQEMGRIAEPATASTQPASEEGEPVVVAVDSSPLMATEDVAVTGSSPEGDGEPTSAADSAPPQTDMTVPTVSTGAQIITKNQEQPEPQRKGILNRLFRRFGR